jgi:hypothetical protein
LNDNYDITSFGAWELVCFAVESVLGIVGGSFVDDSFQNFLLFVYFFAFACLALVSFINDFTFATAVITRSLRLRVHARAQLGHASDDTSTAASCTLLDSAFFSTKTIARHADTLSVDSDLCGFA